MSESQPILLTPPTDIIILNYSEWLYDHPQEARDE